MGNIAFAKNHMLPLFFVKIITDTMKSRTN